MRPLIAVAAVACSISLSAQTPEKRTFEVASIKPSADMIAGGQFKIAHVSPEIYRIFEACNLHSLFTFCPDQQSAIAEFAKSA